MIFFSCNEKKHAIDLASLVRNESFGARDILTSDLMANYTRVSRAHTYLLMQNSLDVARLDLLQCRQFLQPLSRASADEKKRPFEKLSMCLFTEKPRDILKDESQQPLIANSNDVCVRARARTYMHTHTHTYTDSRIESSSLQKHARRYKLSSRLTKIWRVKNFFARSNLRQRDK